MSQVTTRDATAMRLRSFYDEHQIAKQRFACIHKHECICDAAPRPLTHGAEAHVGTRYGEVLTIVVVSLDTGGGSDTLDRRTEIVEQLDHRSLNRHMKGTTRLLRALLGPDVGDSKPYPFFAMINAAKCAATDGKRDRVPDSLYERCRSYAQAELQLLLPDIVVAQGPMAAQVLSARTHIPKDRVTAVTEHFSSSPSGAWLSALAEEYLRQVTLDDHVALGLLTPHPSSRNGQWQRFERLDLPPVAWLARALVRDAKAPAKR